jgi:hypothetical protein
MVEHLIDVKNWFSKYKIDFAKQYNEFNSYKLIFKLIDQQINKLICSIILSLANDLDTP